ncbi:MAG: hypothetical protein EOM76_08940 [Sphingobacteriia bacterium]|nr:hypothetical protein [Sphingobacteriia bacterium]
MAEKWLIKNGNGNDRKKGEKVSKNVAVFNLGSATNCPCKEFCMYAVQGNCYALRDEKRFPDVLPYRERQHAWWNSTTMDEKLAYFDKYFSRKFKEKLIGIRFNESGDIANVSDLIAMDTIATFLKEKYGVFAYTYTHNISVLYEYNCKTLVVNQSIDELTDVQPVKGLNIFTGTKSLNGIVKSCICKGGSCGTKCKLCTVKHGKKIFELIRK